MARLFQCLGVTGCSVSWTASPRTADTALLQVFYPLSGWVGHLTNEMRTQMRTSDHVLITKADKQKGSIRVQALFPGSQMLPSPQSKHITWLKDTPSCQWEDLKTCIVKGKDAERMKIWAGDVNAVAVVQLPRCVQLFVTHGLHHARHPCIAYLVMLLCHIYNSAYNLYCQYLSRRITNAISRWSDLSLFF